MLHISVNFTIKGYISSWFYELTFVIFTSRDEMICLIRMLLHTLVATCLAVLFSHFMHFSTSSTSDCNCTSAYHCHRGILHDLRNRTTWWQGSPTFWVVLITQSRRLYSTGWQIPMTQNAIAWHIHPFYMSISISPALILKRPNWDQRRASSHCKLYFVFNIPR